MTPDELRSALKEPDQIGAIITEEQPGGTHVQRQEPQQRSSRQPGDSGVEIPHRRK